VPASFREIYWLLRRFERRLRQNPRVELPDLFWQYAWFLSPVPVSSIGYGAGPLTWLRKWRHNRLRRPLHIAILEDDVTGLGFGHLMAYWINQQSRLCTASVNKRAAEADIIWVNAQDPLAPAQKQRFVSQIARGKPNVKVMNHPVYYNAYHDPHIFARLAEAGVRVPRSSFGADELGKTLVVYKQLGKHAAEKQARPYAGDFPGHGAYEFIDSRDVGGLYRRYRAHYVAGAVRPGKLMRSSHWNICLKNNPEVIEPSFELRADEADQIRRIAAVSHLDFFAVDFVRRAKDEAAYFIDINIYPTIDSITPARDLGYRGRWHTYETRRRLGIPEPDGRPFSEVFDEAMLNLVQAGSLQPNGAVSAS
jgi:hypothetical protein